MRSLHSRRSLLGIALLCCTATVSPAQEAPELPQPELNWAQKMFEKQNIDFGVVARASDASFRLKITNLYKEPVHIAHVRTTCGCSAGRPSTDTLQSREVGYVEVTMDTLKFTRRKDSNLIVVFDAPLYQEVRIPITAYIRTDVVLAPGSANFGAVDQGMETARKVLISYAGRDDWKIKEVRSKNEHIVASVTETSRSGAAGSGRATYDLNVILKPTAPAGALREQIILVTDDPNSPLVPILVEARVEADITVTPEVVSLGMLTPGQDKTVNVVIRGKKPFEIVKIEADSASGSFKARVPEDARPVHVLPLTITTPNEPGTFNEQFTVTIAGRPEPITFKAFGRIAGAEAKAN